MARHPRVYQPYGAGMVPAEAADARELLEAVVAAYAVLGGSMAYFSGFLAAQALSERQPPHVVAQKINEGIGGGFIKGALPAIAAIIIVVWS
ncbi:MAG TPA: hypothetical protein VF085_09445 [Solirubrobacterales bacterium]